MRNKRLSSKTFFWNYGKFIYDFYKTYIPHPQTLYVPGEV